ELRELQDRVRPFRFRRVQKILERELGSLSRFREIDPTPIAAGSIAQVHRGLLDFGDEVAIKVLRPGVLERVHRDARLFLWIAHMAHVVSARARAADVIGHARSLVAGLVAQADLDREAHNYDLFHAHFPEPTGVQFPRVYHRYSTDRVLTMELIHGVHLERIRPEHVPNVTRAIREAFFAMCFEHGLIHADLHPGNILVRDDGSVVLVDVGLVKHLEPIAIAKLVELSRCLAIGTPQELVAHLRSYRHASTTDWDAVADDVAGFMEELRRAKISNLELRDVVGKLFGLARKHRIRPLSEMSLVLLGMVTIEGIAKRLDPDANTLNEIARYLAPRIAQRPLARGTRNWKEPPGIMFRSAPAKP
ncbi:MAG TPA: AarF/UbiB family protein, partial [Kofleriaceae bacterium]|nr:AarF/UbiB family protein [Kofleriaceae bacterium]